MNQNNSSASITDGDHVGEIVGLTEETHAEGYPVVIWHVRLVDGPQAGTMIQKRYYLKTKKVADFLKKETALLGVKVKDKEEYQGQKDQLLNRSFRFSAATNQDGWQCYYAQGLVENRSATPESKPEDIGW